MAEKDVSAQELCDYLDWAYFNSIDLEGDETTIAAYDAIRSTTCATLSNSVSAATVSFDVEQAHVMTSEFLSKLDNIIDITVAANEQSQNDENPHELPLALNNFVTLTPDILLAFASATLQGVDTQSTLPASSSIAFEVGKDNSLRGYLNDVEHVPLGCTEGNICDVKVFKEAIDALPRTRNV